ncbi:MULTISPECIES: amidohydrolase family protein [Streptomyces]|uniref:amidohydrolase family protein n=1 Tax=Streptomyces TaxID=1883 RepID=UPI0002ACD1BC|nr:amidohydrolase [Streptomyces sp. NRRL WC-3701]KOT63853.1 amidohydrolase [Streptomyces rimosus subsp. rimosus]KOT82753.1 amidohydrolase [Streptomyces rimosus subsp. rimosus]KOT85555.1 amidohydrolase [Streptomyces rimosus subsp. rimosus]
MTVKIIAIEEHWNSVTIREALDRLPDGARDDSVIFNTMGDNQARLEDIGQGRIEAMDAAGIDISVLSVVTPATQALPAREAIVLARDANDEAADAVRAHPDRFRAFATLPTGDPQAAAAELERCATRLGHVGTMVFGRTGNRMLDDPAYDDLLATAARLHQPVFLHPQIASNELRDAAYRGLGPQIGLALASFGWGWHMDAGLAALRLILRGTFDRHPGLQLVLGHWGEMLLFWMDRIEGLSHVATHLERRVSDYIQTNIHITCSGMLQERLLRHTLDFTGADRVLFSTDYPFHRPGAAAVGQFFDAVPSPADRARIASGNAEALFRLGEVR